MKKKKRRRIKKSGIVLIIIIIVFIFFIGNKLLFSDNEVDKIKTSDSILEYGYTLNNNETKYYNKLFKELKEELSKEKIDEEEYAKLISKLFVTDFFTLDNKTDKNDIGGIQFVYADFQSDFKKLAKDSIYKNIENNMYNDRKQELPIVIDTEVLNVEKTDYEYLDNKDDNAYEVNILIKYKKDLKYQKECNLIVVHSNNKLEIVKMY